MTNSADMIRRMTNSEVFLDKGEFRFHNVKKIYKRVQRTYVIIVDRRSFILS